MTAIKGMQCFPENGQPLTVGKLKEFLRDVDDDCFVTIDEDEVGLTKMTKAMVFMESLNVEKNRTIRELMLLSFHCRYEEGKPTIAPWSVEQ